ncbi:MAG: Asp-tRNA(Asn)/Glu-tRNA(Gln) amidotransferase subunit GatC [Patescibacteria group bacterium]|nr:Asp-tRNA(Asn)/Glu-tRNA(Gln) amidotransferase subunit GatC [Patescibacteria group bacterium]
MISKEEVQHIAKLARLGLTEKEVKKFQKELSSILDYIEKLKEVDISKIEPTSHSIAEPSLLEARQEMKTKPSVIKVENVMRDDESEKPKSESKKLLELAPETKDGYLKTKSILK